MKRKPHGSTPRDKLSPTITLKVEYPAEVKNAMIKTLQDMYTEDGLYKLQKIAEQFKLKIGWDKCTSRKAGAIITQLGFRRRDRKGTNGYYHVWIDRETLSTIGVDVNEGRGENLKRRE